MNNSNDINKEIYIEKLEEMTKTLNEKLQKLEKKQDKLVKQGKQPTAKFVAYTNFLKKKLEVENERIALKKRK